MRRPVLLTATLASEVEAGNRREVRATQVAISTGPATGAVTEDTSATTRAAWVEMDMPPTETVVRDFGKMSVGSCGQVWSWNERMAVRVEGHTMDVRTALLIKDTSPSTTVSAGGMMTAVRAVLPEI